jgi:hypothetical protein
MSFGISLPKNVLNLFGDWLHGLDKKKAKLELAFVLFYGQHGMSEMILSLTNQNMLPFYRSFLSLCIGPPCVVMPLAGGVVP